jgi:hypothetical protein
MKKCLAIIVALIPLLAQGAWIDSSGKPIPDTESRQSAGDFGVQILLTADENKFRQTWNSSATPPRLSTTSVVRRGETVSALLLFHGCAPTSAGVCDVDSQFVIESPDGTKTPAGGGPLWSSQPMPLRLLQLGQSSMTVGFDKTDRLGEHRIIANIKDKVTGKTLTVATRLKLRP